MSDEKHEHRLWYRRPATRWLEALPIGNGSLGAMVWGGADEERLDLNLDTLWSGAPRVADIPGTAPVLEQLREAVIGRRDYAAADALALGLQGSFNESYEPLGWLTLRHGAGRGCDRYERSLDLRHGVASVRYGAGERSWEREAFVSVPDRALVVHLAGSEPVDVVVELGSSHLELARGGDETTVWLEGRAPVHVVPDYWDTVPDVVYRRGEGMRFVVALGVRANGGSVRLAAGRAVVEDADDVTLVLAARSGYSGYGEELVDDPLPLRAGCHAVLGPLAEEPYETLRRRHRAEHRAMSDRCALDLGPPGDAPTDERVDAVRHGADDEGLAALLFHYGRYLLMGSSRPRTQAANLQGIWNDAVRPPWSCNWTTNINVQMNYWPAETTNLAECHEPLMDLVADLSEAGRRTARDLYGCRGWACHHNVDIWRSTWPTGEQRAHPYWVNWQMGGPWLCQHVWEHFLFSGRERPTGDEYALLREAALFVLDYLVRDGEGRLVTCPSTSPENSFRTGDGTEAAVSAASSLDVWLARDLFRHCVTASEMLRVDEELAAELAAALADLPEPAIGSDGRLREWWEPFEEPEPGHRHLSHLFPVYPGDEAAAGSALEGACRQSLEHRIAHGGASSDWNRAWAIGLWARLREGAIARDHLGRFLREDVVGNLFTVPHPGVFQIDGIFGVTAAIAEMLLQSHRGSLDLLPALPPEWRDGEVHGLRARGGRTVGIRWSGGTTTSVRVEVLRADTVPIRCAARLRLRGDGPAGTALVEGGERGVVELVAPTRGVYTLVADGSSASRPSGAHGPS